MRLQREDLHNKHFYEIGEELPWQTCLWAADKSEGLSPRQTSMDCKEISTTSLSRGLQREDLHNNNTLGETAE
jgi:hypothetical protein